MLPTAQSFSDKNKVPAAAAAVAESGRGGPIKSTPGYLSLAHH
jgi:hypothetical protein